MSEEKLPERDGKGDMNDGNTDLKKIMLSPDTYVFHYYDKVKNFYFPYFKLSSLLDEKIEKKKGYDDYYEVDLFQPLASDNLRDRESVGVVRGFFTQVLEKEPLAISPFYTKIILPKSKYNEIDRFIKKYSLGDIKDSLFELIAKIQSKYIIDIIYRQREDHLEKVKNIHKEVRKVVEVIERWRPDGQRKLLSELSPDEKYELSQIKFVFKDNINKDKTIKIEDEGLVGEFIEHFRNYYNNLPHKNWRTDLNRYAERYTDNDKKNKFKYNVAISFYNLLTQTNLFKVSGETLTPNRLMLCIANLLEFCLIPVTDDDDELDENKVKAIRNWVNRNELQPLSTHAEILPNNERLRKYFGNDFFDITVDVNQQGPISVGKFLCKRFNISDKLFEDLVFVAAVLIRYNERLVGFQWYFDGEQTLPSFDEFEYFSKLLVGVRSGHKKLTSIKFKMEGDDHEYELHQRLPLHLLEGAVVNYFDNYPEEMTDLKHGEEARFNRPEERFVVRFVKAFYDYLEMEDSSLSESNRYEIIAQMLYRTVYDEYPMLEEDFYTDKVKKWHRLAL